mgnify:CR=1 FL=1
MGCHLVCRGIFYVCDHFVPLADVCAAGEPGVKPGRNSVVRDESAEKGCGYGVRLNEAKLRRAVALLDERGIDRGRAFLLSRLTGEYREVPL